MKHLLFLLASLVLFSQESQTPIKGSIQFVLGEGIYEDIRITNLRSQEFVFTNILGQFTIQAQEGDVLEIKAMHIYTEYATISAHNYKQKNIILIIEPLEYTLEDLTIYSFSGNLEYDSKRIKYVNEMDEILKKMGIQQGKPRDELAHLSKPVVPVIPLSADLDALYQIISGNRKRGKDFYFHQEREKIIYEVKDYYGEKYFIESLQIPKLEIYGFLITVYVNNTQLKELVKARSFYLILPLLQSESFKYKLRLETKNNP